MTADFTPAHTAAADQALAEGSKVLDGAVAKMRQLLASESDSEVAVVEMFAVLADLCDIDPQIRSSIVFGYCAALHRLARQ